MQLKLRRGLQVPLRHYWQTSQPLSSLTHISERTFGVDDDNNVAVVVAKRKGTDSDVVCMSEDDITGLRIRSRRIRFRC